MVRSFSNTMVYPRIKLCVCVLAVIICSVWSQDVSQCNPNAGDAQRNIQEAFFNVTLPVDQHDFPGPPISSKPVSRLVFASCNHQSKPQTAWQHIAKQSPDAFVWMGDIVYLDRHEVKSWTKLFEPPTKEKFHEIYGMQRNHKDYCPLIRNKMPVLGVWDDHDMGRNDGDHTYPLKDFAQQRLLDFLDVPSQQELETLEQQVGYQNLTTLQRAWLGRRKQTGAYNSHVMGEPGKRVKVILLDNRFFQNEIPGDMLGDAQWQWLEDELEQAAAPYGTPEYDRGGAELVVIATGIQVIGWGKIVGEGWRQFPASRSRLLTLLAKTTSPTIVSTRTPPAVLLFSGDVHFAEAARTFACSIREGDKMRQCNAQEVVQMMQQTGVPTDGIALTTAASIIEGKSEPSDAKQESEIDLSQVEITPVVELTTSGMTHAWGELLNAPFIFTPLTEIGFPILNRQHLTNFDYKQIVPGFGPWQNPISLASSLVDALSPTLGGSAPDNRDSQHATARPANAAPVLTERDLEVLKSQKSFYTKRNYASIDITWGETGALEAQGVDPAKVGYTGGSSWVTLRIHSAVTGEPVMVYPLPFEALRSFSPQKLNSKTIPKEMMQEALNQCLKEAVERITPPFILPLAALFRIIALVLLVIIAVSVWIGIRTFTRIRNSMTTTKRKEA